MSNWIQDLQSAIYLQWSTQYGYAGAPASLHYGFAPEKTAYPYITYTVHAETEPTWGTQAQAVTIVFHVFSSLPSSAEASGIAEDIKTIFDRQKLLMTGHSMPVCLRVQNELLDKSDRQNWQYTLVMGCKVTPNGD